MMMNQQKTVKKNSLRAWLLAARPKTLSGAAVPVMIGLALAWSDAQAYYGGVFSWTAAILCMLFAFVMQIDANFINDFFDYVKGTDDRATRLGPERACSQGWVSIQAMKRAIAFTTCLACVMGLPLVWFGGLEMIAVGVLCVLFCFLYTTHLSYMGLGDVLVLLFFGLVIDALLLVNNFRDRDTDAQAGKTTLVVRLGARVSLWLYLGVGVMACALGGIFLMAGHVLAFVLPFVYLVLHVFTWLHMKSIWQGRELNNCLGETARNILIYGLLVAAGVLL